MDEKSKAMVLIGQEGTQDGDQSEARVKDGKIRTKSPFRSGLTAKKGMKGGKGGGGGGGGMTALKSGKKGKKTAEEEDGKKSFTQGCYPVSVHPKKSLWSAVPFPCFPFMVESQIVGRAATYRGTMQEIFCPAFHPSNKLSGLKNCSGLCRLVQK